MESDEEPLRLDLKTKREIVEEQARFAGIKPGMRLIDIGCGSGKTTSILKVLAQPGGRAIGIDMSESRVRYAQEHYGSEGVEFLRRDMRDALDDLGEFDFMWIRFVLEYYRAEAESIVKHVIKILKPGGILCLTDLDYNCMTHFGMPARLEKTTIELIETMETKANFDPYAGRKLYSYLYKLNFADIRVHAAAHHLIYGKLSAADGYNWTKKLEVAGKRMNHDFHRYSSGYEGYKEEFNAFFNDPGRFTYTPVISVCGYKDDILPTLTRRSSI
jgi:ubiquinone/menaquinone biosynthesis C-methylase UbiE